MRGQEGWFSTRTYRGYTLNIIGGVVHILDKDEHICIEQDFEAAKKTIDEWKWAP